MKLNKIVALTSLVAAISATPLFAGTKTLKEVVVVEEKTTPLFNAALSTGYDSLYMFRGANVIGTGNNSYGSSLYWTDLNATWNITSNDMFNVGSWQAFGLVNTDYKENDVYATYTHLFGDFAASLGYTFYNVFSFPLYANELSAKLAYTAKLGDVTITPSATYYFELGPDLNNKGSQNAGTSFLAFRVDSSIPLYKDIVSLQPWVGFGLNFDYNQKQTSEGLVLFNGANNLETGLAVPVKINSVVSVSGYVAYSYAFYNLFGTTEPSTFWGGGKVTFSF